jgi:hypothetical protein
VTWQVCTGENDRGDSTYATAVGVPGRAVSKLRDIIGASGEVTTVQFQVNTLIAPGIGDLLNGREVVTVAQQVTVGGDIIGFLSLTR